LHKLKTHHFIQDDQLESEFDIDPETDSSFNKTFLPDPKLDAFILGSEIGRNLSLNTDIYKQNILL
jgi:hypothetical protein